MWSSYFLIVAQSSLVLNHPLSQLPLLLSKLQKPFPPLEVAHPLLYLLPPLFLLPNLTLGRAGRPRSDCCLPCWRTRPGGFMPMRPSCSPVWLWVSGSWTQPPFLLGLEILPPNKTFPFSCISVLFCIASFSRLTGHCWKQAFALKLKMVCLKSFFLVVLVWMFEETKLVIYVKLATFGVRGSHYYTAESFYSRHRKLGLTLTDIISHHITIFHNIAILEVNTASQVMEFLRLKMITAVLRGAHYRFNGDWNTNVNMIKVQYWKNNLQKCSLCEWFIKLDLGHYK